MSGQLPPRKVVPPGWRYREFELGLGLELGLGSNFPRRQLIVLEPNKQRWYKYYKSLWKLHHGVLHGYIEFDAEQSENTKSPEGKN